MELLSVRNALSCPESPGLERARIEVTSEHFFIYREKNRESNRLWAIWPPLYDNMDDVIWGHLGIDLQVTIYRFCFNSCISRILKTDSIKKIFRLCQKLTFDNFK